MGLFGGDSSSSQTTNVKNINVGAEEGGISVSEGGSVNVLDAGAVQRALDLGNESIVAALDASAKQNFQAYGFVEGALADTNSAFNDALDSAFSFARDSLGFVQDVSQRTLTSSDKAIGEVLDIQDATQTGGSERLLILGGVALVALLAMAYFNR